LSRVASRKKTGRGGRGISALSRWITDQFLGRLNGGERRFNRQWGERGRGGLKGHWLEGKNRGKHENNQVLMEERGEQGREAIGILKGEYGDAGKQNQ